MISRGEHKELLKKYKSQIKKYDRYSSLGRKRPLTSEERKKFLVLATEMNEVFEKLRKETEEILDLYLKQGESLK